MSTAEMTDTKVTTKITIEPNLELQPPKKYKVIYVNDEVTTMEFVVESLMSVFNYDQPTAETITFDVHEKGSATVAVLPYELAEQKGVEVTVLARNNGYPLVVRLEVDE